MSAAAAELPGAADQTRVEAEAAALSSAVGIDCEMVRLRSGRSALARCCIVAYADERVLLDSFVHVPPVDVGDYLTQYSGVCAADLCDAPPFDAVRERAVALIADNLLVGHGLVNDIKALRLNIPHARVRDTLTLGWEGRRSLKLRDLARDVLGERVQTAEHSPVEDAVTAVRLHKHHRRHGGAAAPRLVRVQLCTADAQPPPLDAPCTVAAAAGGAPQPTWDLEVGWDRRILTNLFRWFALRVASPDRRADTLRFPADLSREERRMVHREVRAPPSPAPSRTSASPRRHLV